MEFFVEIGCEEIPASFLPPALSQMKQLFSKAAETIQLPFTEIRTLGTPRRLVLIVDGIPRRQQDREEQKLGPAVRAGFDKEGNPTRALLGFAKSQGLEVSELEKFSVEAPKKGEYFGYRKKIIGKNAHELLSEILQEIVPKISFRKTMRWGACQERFARPIHWVCAVFDQERIPFSFGTPKQPEYIESSIESFGHRFHSPTPFSVKNSADYIEKARTGLVLVDPKERKETIRKGLETLATEAKASLLADPDLLEEVNWLVEFPVPLLGSFDPAFLEIPREVLITSMRNHQRFFALEDPETGKLRANFLTVAGTVPKDISVVRAGNERVLQARLADASFFFEEDQKKSLEAYAKELSHVTFQAKLGSYAKKVERLLKIVPWMAEVVSSGQNEVVKTAKRACLLCKADLVTGMVGEFPELQGIMGREYGKRQGETEAVAEAIAEHYLPSGETDPLPESEAGAIVSLADKFDSVVSLYAIGLGPTAAKDFYAIRRQTLGIIRIILDKKLSLPLTPITCMLAKQLQEENIKISFQSTLLSNNPKKKVTIDSVDGLAQEIGEFCRTRLRGILEEQQIRSDLINAIFSLRIDDLLENAQRTKALQNFSTNTRFVDFCDLAKRVRKISLGAKDPKEKLIASRQNRPEGGFEYPHLGEVDPKLFEVDAEHKMFGAFCTAKDILPKQLEKKEFAKALNTLANLINPVDQFMNHGPMVLCKEEDLRKNRITLCANLDKLLSSFADFSKVHAS